MTTPDPIRRFVEATNSGDTDAFLDTFADNAFLSDWGRSFQGREQIARWNQSDNIGVKSRLGIVSITPADGTYRVRIAVKGKGFNGEGDMTFTLDGDHIASLVIT
ncbi:MULTISPECIES: nuclear transport factor 2 family protein [unclassified Mesorhizobium]|uniref:nuclear transport factor 2 family protein n=1 Tax=unclassified Mesorhizobium TaxID=325217 RepID=UPI000FCB4F1C|nr:MULTISPECIES: nuclear transport factor 2 family protein [unclassified Mesorhizobium]TGV76478.1 nuclear transport factor 2 family protein [Mesorhizobium sp. M00.F.Ca.ET.158.01.1.1]RUW49637.1 nuclear transport factor 2 family protein [Mesorhizobium sp. M8A.F.Ca.ET.021.01.1.1]RWF51499.1 MAG: nuclear transport factor 2 family protein [Mesorhizobium sp.]TGP91103.1 nuclear transport factor 2 family protein [Mesorhizobium sp. M8A.F.Ca.ET.218.01.1.1]TGS45087.1 nuclear transport factor 2 family prot